MPLNNFSVGRDIALSVDTPTGPLVLSLITAFDSKQEVIKKKVKGLDGITRKVNFPDGWLGSFEVERQNSVVDDYFCTLEAAFYAGQNQPNATITETVSEPDGSVHQYQYKNVALYYEQRGPWRGDDTVKLKITFDAERRLKLS